MKKSSLKLGRKFNIELPAPPFKEGVILIRGMNGSGKTTLLRVLASKFDIDLKSFVGDNAEQYLNHSAVFFEETTLSHGETLAKNLEYINYLLETDRDKQKGYIQQLRLDEVMNRKFKKCSTGEKKKFLSILNITQTNKTIYYLDEPFENIDAQSKKNLLSILKKEFVSTSKTLYITTHNTEVIKSIPYFDFCID